MAIIGTNVVMGFGDVLLSGHVKGITTEPTAQIRFSQLDNPHYDPDVDSVDKSVTPITITTDLEGLETLHKMVSGLLTAIYERQIYHLEKIKNSLQTEET